MLLQPHKQNSLFQDEESIFKSIGFYGFGGGGNSLGLGLNSTGFNRSGKIYDNRMVSIDSNSFSDFQIQKSIKDRNSIKVGNINSDQYLNNG